MRSHETTGDYFVLLLLVCNADVALLIKSLRWTHANVNDFAAIVALFLHGLAYLLEKPSSYVLLSVLV